ncbi:hypothetical protein [Clostridium botulinum]|uniref:hypothetical protein n=1 Tax=Clostridium botulinum TaxID=1491 RepID=UPI0019676D36|nr:hypothetical protein [Clostridium botulinum]MBN1058568.1 hypothetical protein [Clostridium botulinum]
MNMKELKLLNKKELCVWSSTVKAIQLKAILREKGIKGYSKYKKAQLLESVLDLVIQKDIEKVEAEIVIENKDIDLANNIIKDSVDSDFNVINMVKDNIRINQKCEGLGQAFGVKTKEKSKEDYVREAVEKNNAKFKQLDKDIDEVKNSKEVVNRLNSIFSSLESGLKAELDIKYNNDSKNLNHNIYIYAHNICIESNLDYIDIYIPTLDEYISRTNEKINREWLDAIQENGKSLREEYYNNNNVIYVIGDGDDITEVPLNVQPEKSNIFEYKLELFDSPITEIDMTMSDYYDVRSSAKSGLIDYSIETDELLSINRFKKGQKAEMTWINYNAVLDLEEKTNRALKINNNIIKELN